MAKKGKKAKKKAKKVAKKVKTIKVHFEKKTMEQHLAEIRSHSLGAAIYKCGTSG